MFSPVSSLTPSDREAFHLPQQQTSPALSVAEVNQPNPGGPLACPDRGFHLGRRHLGSRHSQCPSPAAQRRQFAQAEGAANLRHLTACNRLWRDHSRPAGAPPPRPTSVGTAGRLRSEQVADINRNARPTSSESASSTPLGSDRPAASARSVRRLPAASWSRT